MGSRPGDSPVARADRVWDRASYFSGSSDQLDKSVGFDGQRRPDPLAQAVAPLCERHRVTRGWCLTAEEGWPVIVEIAQYGRDVECANLYVESPAGPLGALAPWRTTILILLVVLGMLAAAGVGAQFLHGGGAQP